jgi:hypothetical protein
MNRSLISAALAFLAGCGSSGNAALSKSFSYGAAQAPSASEQMAANSAQASVSDTASFSAGADAVRGAAIGALAESLAAAAFGSTAFGVAHPSGSEISRALRTATDFSSCTTVTANTVTFKDCAQTEGGYTVTLNGNISSNAGAVTWEISGGFSGTSSQAGIAINIHQSGTFTVTASKITGHSLSDFSGSVSAGGQSISFGFATAAVVDLTYQTSPVACITGGTVEVKRVWTAKPPGAVGPLFDDLGVKLSWTGCGSVLVAHSQ